jgi:pyruvate ferredoxin oxidoreductase gamma subunit
MGDVIEIRIHGRGGQGAVTAAEILAVAAFKDGKFSQAFPKFGPERRGSPIEAYCRISDEFINLRTFVYNPDYLIILDDSLLDMLDLTQGLKKTGVVVINSEGRGSNRKLDGFKVFSINATKIAMDMLGKPIVNTVMLGAFAKATGLVLIKNLTESVGEKFEGELKTRNVSAVKRAYEEMK